MKIPQTQQSFHLSFTSWDNAPLNLPLMSAGLAVSPSLSAGDLDFLLLVPEHADEEHHRENHCIGEAAQD